MSDPRPIGVFDSGVGGLTVLRAIREALPEEATLYLGDTARVPYGTKSPETVTRFALESGRFLAEQGIKLLVVACNTASAMSLEALRAVLPIPVVGVLEPGARAAVRATRTGRIGVIGTEATIASGAYPQALQTLRPGLEVVSRACPLFVPLAEEGWTDNEVAYLTAERYLAPLRDRIDTLILGCTHYPLLRDTIQKVMGAGVALIDSARETAIEVTTQVRRQGLRGQGGGTPRYYVTDAPARFRAVGERFLDEPLEHVEWIRLGEDDAA
ncbi:MAG: glutamate racemase [Nitrospirae bacterium]|nr:glutamate racemase [Nitrospirota bacterium]